MKYLTVDCEGLARIASEPPASIGMVLFDTDTSSIISTFYITIQVPNPDQDTLDWHQSDPVRKAAYEHMVKTAIPVAYAAEKLRKYCNFLATAHAPITILSNNSSYNIALVDRVLAVANTLPLRFAVNNPVARPDSGHVEYGSVKDIDEYIDKYNKAHPKPDFNTSNVDVLKAKLYNGGFGDISNIDTSFTLERHNALYDAYEMLMKVIDYLYRENHIYIVKTK
jgi:hypothetical protein